MRQVEDVDGGHLGGFMRCPYIENWRIRGLIGEKDGEKQAKEGGSPLG